MGWFKGIREVARQAPGSWYIRFFSSEDILKRKLTQIDYLEELGVRIVAKCQNLFEKIKMHIQKISKRELG